jgi:phosphatidylserine decarboxylase
VIALPHKEGLGIIIGLILLSVVVMAGGYLTGYTHIQFIAFLSVAFTLMVIFFFRDPERRIPEGKNVIVSPADGKIVQICEIDEPEFLKERVTRVSIFLSILDVHVNRIPMSGEVAYLRYQKGSFMNACKSEASDVNEQTVIGIQNGNRKLLFKQIAGLIARRIVCDVREGNIVTAGERFGIIKFGSRADIFLPRNVSVKVNLNQHVKGGESIIGVVADEE